MNELTGRILHSLEKQATELCEQLEWEQLKSIRDNIRHILSTEFIETTVEVEEKDFINNMFKKWKQEKEINNLLKK